MKKYIILIIFLAGSIASLQLHAQYTGGNGRGDATLAVSASQLGNTLFSNVWNDGPSWSSGEPPTSSEKAYIKEFGEITSNTNALAGELHILSGSQLWLSSGTLTTNKITCDGDLLAPLMDGICNITTGDLSLSSTGHIYIQEQPDYALSLIVTGTFSNANPSNQSVQADYLLVRPTNQQWQFMSAPVSGMTIAGSNLEPTANDDLYCWDEPSPGTWVNFKNTTISPTFLESNGSGAYMPGKGYLAAFNKTSWYYYFESNTLNAGNLNVPISYHAGKSSDWSYTAGWNLIGNPYTSGIDWSVADRSKFEDNFAYIYDPNKAGGEGYITVNGGNPAAYIGSGQGFFVKAKNTSNGQNFQFNSTMQVHAGTAYKSTTSSQSFKIRLTGNSYYDETSIVLSDNAAFARERDDALKLNSYNTSIPQVYTYSSDQYKLDVNTIPNVQAEDGIGLGTLIPANGQYTLSVDDQAKSLFPSGIFVEDKLLGKIENLCSNVYSFTANSGTINDRFQLKFSALGTGPQPNPDGLKAWYNEGKLFVEQAGSDFQITIRSMTGSVVYQKDVAKTAAFQEDIHLNQGVYIIEVTSQGSRKVFKVSIS